MTETEVMFYQETMTETEFYEFLISTVLNGQLSLELAIQFKGEMK